MNLSEMIEYASARARDLEAREPDIAVRNARRRDLIAQHRPALAAGYGLDGDALELELQRSLANNCKSDPLNCPSCEFRYIMKKIVKEFVGCQT